jgi:polar amino acid transport system substrate-binding protein
MVLNGLEATSDRKEAILFSRPYFAYEETLAVRKEDPARSLADMAGRHVGTLNQTYAFQVLGGASGIKREIYEGTLEPYDDLAAGRLDGVLLESIIADRYGCGNPAIRCVPQDDLRGSYIIGFRKEDTRLKSAIDEALEGMMADGELRRILEKWGLWNDDQSRLPATANAAPTGAVNLGVQALFFLEAAGITLAVSIASFLLAVPIGLGLALARLYGGRWLGGAAAAYVEIMRGTPVLLQLMVLYYGLGKYVPIPVVVAAVLGLGLNYEAYESEVYRGALRALPRGQTEAAHALGLTRFQTFRHVLVPQAFRHALPAMTNDFVALLKDSSLVSVIRVIELTARMRIAAVETNGYLFPGLACAALYFAMSFPLARLAQRLEKRLSRDPHPRAA